MLGSLRLRRGDDDVAVTRPKSRGLLGLLLARANHPVSGEQLVEELWSGRPPSSARGALRVHATHLRHALAAADDGTRPDRLTAGAAGYRLAVSTEEMDALAFERAFRTAREAADAGASHEVRELLGGALSWWRGIPYADLTDFAPLAAEAVRLAEVRASALELLADAFLALGRPEDAVDLLTGPVHDDPVRESFTERLMLALYRSGRAFDALRAFSRLREALDEQLAVEPGPAVRRLEESIVVRRPELDLADASKRPTTVSVLDALPIVGRRREIAAIERAWDHLDDARPGLVLVSGPAGIGKTTLVHGATRRMEAEGAHVLVGHCDPEPSSDYEPIPQLVRAALALLDPEDRHDPLLGELGRLVPDEAGRLPSPPPTVDPSTGRLRLFTAVTALFEAVGPAPIVLVAEDLHWAGSDAFALLRHLLHSSRGSMVVVVTYRDDELDPGSPAVQAMAQGRLADPDVAIGLDGLDAGELSALVRAWGVEQHRRHMLASIDELHDLTAGNPMFVRAVLREVGESSEMPALDTLAPGGIRALVERGLARLPIASRSTLAVAAVLGREFSVALLTATAGIDEVDALAAIDHALSTRILVETELVDHFAFSHLVVRNTIYSATTTARRARLHLRAGEALADGLDGDPEGRAAECARHFLAALPLGDPGRAASWARAAGREATQRFAHADAISWYRRAVELAEPARWSSRDTAAALLELAAALDENGERNEARARFVDAAEMARTAGDHLLFADAAIGATPRYVTVYDFEPTQRALVDEALERVGTDRRRLAALLCCASAGRYYQEPGDKPYAIRALALARESDDPEIRATGLLTYHRYLTHDPSATEERLSLSRELLAICQAAGLDELTGRAARAVLIDLLGLGYLDDFDRELDVLSVYADEHGAPADIYWVSAFHATRRLMIDPWGEAEELVRAARRIGRELQQDDAEGAFILHSFALRYQQGRAREVTGGLETPESGHPRILAGLSLLAAALVA
ncbi:MAG TPA: BTAD domain-containing putative transcriptional regulator, partial [Acidimicrobiia bacterium]